MLNRILLGVIGLCAGMAVAQAVAALAAAIGVYPRLAAKVHEAKYILWFETVAQLGIVVGTVLSVFPVKIVFARSIAVIWGGFVGVYVGCFLMALAEVVQAFPIMFRRTKMKLGLNYFVVAIAIGKLCGSLYYFYMKMWKK